MKFKKNLLISSAPLIVSPLFLVISCSNSNNPETPPIDSPTEEEIKYDVTFNGINQDFYINNEYKIIASLNPQLSTAFFDWQTDSNLLNLSSANKNEISINPTIAGSYKITLNVYEDTSKSKILVSNKVINLQVKDYQVEILPEASYDVNKTYKLSANVSPNNQSYLYKWSCDDTSLKLTNTTSKAVSFTSSVARSYVLKLEVSNSEMVIVAKKISLNFVETIIPYEYTIGFNLNKDSFVYGDQTKLVSDSLIDENWVKKKIKNNKEAVFTFSNVPFDFDWDTNIKIESLTKDDQNKSLFFNLILNNSNHENKTIQKTLSFTKFKDPSIQNVDYVQFQNQDVFSFGNPNKFVSEKNITSELKQEIINNKEQIFIIPDNWDPNFDWNTNIRFSTSIIQEENGILSINVTLTNSSPTNQQISRELTFTGYKKGISYNIEINDGIDGLIGFPLGDSKRFSSEVNVDWVKQQVLNNKNMIFNYRRLPDDYDWESNIEIESYNLLPNDEGRALTFELTLLNPSSSSKSSISKWITFNDFKQKSWTTNSMPTDSELLINDFNFPTGSVIKSFLTSSNRGQKLNEYGVVRTFSLINRILLDTLFSDDNFNNKTISMKNNNFNTIEFSLKGTATKSISNWGKNTIPVSGIIENWNGASISSGQNVELIIKYSRISNSNSSGTDKFDLSKLITWSSSGITGINFPTWKGRQIDFMFLNEFSSWGSVKVNGSNIKTSQSPDNRSFFVFMHTYNGINYVVDSSSFLSRNKIINKEKLPKQKTILQMSNHLKNLYILQFKIKYQNELLKFKIEE